MSPAAFQLLKHAGSDLLTRLQRAGEDALLKYLCCAGASMPDSEQILKPRLSCALVLAALLRNMQADVAYASCQQVVKWTSKSLFPGHVLDVFVI